MTRWTSVPGTRLSTGRPIAASRAEAAAQEEVVALDALAGRAALAQGRPLQADVADPVVGAGVRAAVEVEAQALRPPRRKRSPGARRSPAACPLVSATVKLQNGSPVQAMLAPRSPMPSSGKPSAPTSRGRPRRAAPPGCPARMKFCRRVMRMLAAAALHQVGQPDAWPRRSSARGRPGSRRRRAPAASAAWMPVWSFSSAGAGGAAPSSSRRPSRSSTRARKASGPRSSTMNLRRALARDSRYLRSSRQTSTIARSTARASSGGTQTPRSSDEARPGREPAPHPRRRSRAGRLARRADEGDAVDLRRVALVRAGRDGDLVLARQVGVVAVAR